MPKKCILLLLDGLGDRSYEELSFQTPLQAARTPVLDNIAASGASGLYHAAALGQALPSENAHFTMFGYHLSEFPGRGCLEALGAGIYLKPDDVAVLAHFASLRKEKNFLVLERGKPKASKEEKKAMLGYVTWPKDMEINNFMRWLERGGQSYYFNYLIEDKLRDKGGVLTISDLYDAIMEGAVDRVRPKIMTVLSTMVGLFPLFWGHGAGADTMRRIAAPMIGGMVTSTILTLIVIPAIYAIWKGRGTVDG